LPTKAGGVWFFFPSYSEGKNHPPLAFGDCNIRQFVRLLRGDEISNNDNEPLPCPEGLARFLPGVGRIARSKNRAKMVFADNGFKTGMNLKLFILN